MATLRNVGTNTMVLNPLGRKGHTASSVILVSSDDFTLTPRCMRRPSRLLSLRQARIASQPESHVYSYSGSGMDCYARKSTKSCDLFP